MFLFLLKTFNKLRSIKLDVFVFKHKSTFDINQVDILKLDIEGSEHRYYEILAADVNLPKVLCVEFDYYWSMDEATMQTFLKSYKP